MGKSQSNTLALGYYVEKYEEKEGETKPLRRTTINEDEELTKTPIEGTTTLLEAFIAGAHKNKDRPCLGTRTVPSDGSFGPYQWKSYKEVDQLAMDLSRGFMKLNLCSFAYDHDGTPAKLIGIYCKNREEFTITEIAAWYNATGVVTLYDSLGMESTEYIINHTELSSIILSAANLTKILRIKNEDNLPKLKNAVLVDEPDEELIKKAGEGNIQVFRYSDVIEIGKASDLPLEYPTTDTICTICYTSGTTGNPKGVVLTHAQALSCTAGGIGVSKSMPLGWMDLTNKDKYISYLPLAHMLERQLLYLSFTRGCGIGYFHGNVFKLTEDLKELKPNMFISVPRLYNRFYDLIMTKVSETKGFKKKLLKRALKVKLANLRKDGSVTHKLYDALVFNKIKKILGGNVRIMLSGAAPIAGDVLETLQVCFCCHIIQGYGQTELCGGSHMSHPGDPTSSHCGTPLTSLEIKLIDVPEMNYFTNHFENEIYMPKGEVCYRGNGVMKGYFKNKEKTEETIDKEGWLHTGDVGQIIQGGRLMIVDRIKNIFKLQQGEYVAAEKLENIFGKSQFVSQIFVYGDSFKNFLVGIIFPNEQIIQKWSLKKNYELTFEELCTNEELIEDIFEDLRLLGKEAKLNGFEFLKKISLTSTGFSIENHTLTPTFKIVRHEAKKMYLDEITKLYHDIDNNL